MPVPPALPESLILAAIVLGLIAQFIYQRRGSSQVPVAPPPKDIDPWAGIQRTHRRPGAPPSGRPGFDRPFNWHTQVPACQLEPKR